jgi:catechol 2,3-dioxygenase-like lactoylglutathione lyase family enzyme
MSPPQQAAMFVKVFPYQDNVLALPVKDLDEASRWYVHHFGMTEVARMPPSATTEGATAGDASLPTVTLERDGTRIGFCINGGDASQDGAAILVSNIRGLHDEWKSRGLVAERMGDLRVEERDGQKFHVFSVVAPNGLCFYVHEPMVS